MAIRVEAGSLGSSKFHPFYTIHSLNSGLSLFRPLSLSLSLSLSIYLSIYLSISLSIYLITNDFEFRCAIVSILNRAYNRTDLPLLDHSLRTRCLLARSTRIRSTRFRFRTFYFCQSRPFPRRCFFKPRPNEWIKMYTNLERYERNNFNGRIFRSPGNFAESISGALLPPSRFSFVAGRSYSIGRWSLGREEGEKCGKVAFVVGRGASTYKYIVF